MTADPKERSVNKNDLEELTTSKAPEIGNFPKQGPKPDPSGKSSIVLIDPRLQVRLAKKDNILQVIFPKAENTPIKSHWSELWEQLQYRLKAGEAYWKPGIIVQLVAQDQLLDNRQLHAIATALAQVKLQLKQVQTSRRQTAVTAAAAGYNVEQKAFLEEPQPQQVVQSSGGNDWAEPLYLKSTIRSGVEIQHPGTVVILGDTNPGSRIIATGDILILGRLRGIAHAGSQGNRSSHILALQMEATQLRIADFIARPPESPPEGYYPEIAYVTSKGIRLAKAVNFFKTYSFSEQKGNWVEI